MTYSFKLRRTSKHCMIRLVADTLLSLYHVGWDPLTPVEMESKKMGKQTAICFSRRQNHFYSTPSLSRVETSMDKDTPCLCIETYHDSYLVFHHVPNTVLNELVTSAHNHWGEGIQGVSMAVSSVIRDYTTRNHAVLTTGPLDSQDKFIKLRGKPWTVDAEEEFVDVIATENLEVAIIACLAQEGYKLSIAISFNTSSRAFFFIKDEEDSKEVRLLTEAIAGMGLKDSLCIYRPIIKRSRSSFFRSFNNRESLNRRVKKSLKKKIGKESLKINSTTKTAWFRQTSTDVGTDNDDDDEEDNEDDN